MKALVDIIALICFAAIPISGFLTAGFLAYHEKKGWGWLLIVVVIIFSGIRIKTN